jgi:hypothetical protein
MNHRSGSRAASFIIFIAMLVLPGAGFAGEQVRGSGVVRIEQRLVPHFTTIESACMANVVIERGEHDSITVEAEDNILPLIETKVADRKLTLTTKSNASIGITRGISFRITARELKGVSISGTGSVVANKVDAKSFAINISGTGKVELSGKAESLDVTISGSGSVNALRMPVRSAEADVTGSGKIFVNAADRLIANIVGNGYVEYAGNPQVTKRITGTGRVYPRPGN